MKKILCVIMIMTACSCWSAGKSAKIFMVNLFAQNIDVQLGEDNAFIYKANGIEPYTPSYYVTTEKTGDYFLYFKLSDGNDWYFLADSNETKLICSVKPSKVYAIVIDERGIVRFFECNDSSALGAKVAFFNGSFDTVNRMEVGSDWMAGNAAYSDTLESYSVTDFVAFAPSGFSLYWQFPYQSQAGSYFFYPDEKNTPLKFNFEGGKYYLFMIYTVEGADYGRLYDITPPENNK